MRLWNHTRHRSIPGAPLRCFRHRLAAVAALLIVALAQSGCVGLTGTTTSADVLQFTPAKVEFGDVAMGAKKTRPVTLTNTGDEALTLPQALIAGASYSLSGLDLPVTIEPGGTLTFTASFSPTISGPTVGTIVVSSDTPGLQPEALALNGAGITASGPTITTQPLSLSVTVGQVATFSVSATGAEPLAYQWKKNGADILGANNATYTTPAVSSSDSGSEFTVTVSDASGSVTSDVATLTVTANPVPPTITSQPVSRSVTVGQGATFSVTVSGTSPLSYQWRKNGQVITGATAPSYTTPPATSADNGAQFSVIVLNSVGSVISNSAALTVSTPVTITSHPSNITVVAGQTARFSVTANGAFSIGYQWRRNGVNITGATGPSYTTPATTSVDNDAQFSVLVSGPSGSVLSNTARLTVTAVAVAPSIASQPANRTVAAGQTATFTVTVSGTAPLSYQWRKNGTNIGGATASSYTTPAASNTDNGAQFSVVVNNSVGSVTSNAATLTVNNPPTITTQPAGRSVLVGQTASFSVTATGTGPLSYQWRKNGTNIGGATTSSYTTPAANASDNGAQFTVVISNPSGNVTSNAAPLTVSSAPSITSHPSNQTVVAGQTASFSVTATGTGPLSYQWKKNGANIGGATTSNYTTSATATGDNGAQFSVAVSNSVGNITSNAATLTVTAATLQLTASPASLSFGSVSVGDSETLPVTIRNAGNSNVSVNNLALSGSGFSASGLGSGQTLTPGQTVILNIRFEPSGSGNASGSVTITSNAGNSPATVTLSGTGVQPVQHSVLLSWSGSSTPGVQYFAYRGTNSGGPYAKLNGSPISSSSYTDSTAQSGTTYFYVVTAVDSDGLESNNSNQAQVNVPTP